MCVDANETGPLFLKEVLNFIYGKTGIRNNFGAIRWTGTVLMGVVDKLRGTAWGWATQHGNYLTCNIQLCFTPQVL